MANPRRKVAAVRAQDTNSMRLPMMPHPAAPEEDETGVRGGESARATDAATHTHTP